MCSGPRRVIPIIGQDTDGTITPQDLGHGLGRSPRRRPTSSGSGPSPGPTTRGRTASTWSGCCRWTRAAAARGCAARRDRGACRAAGADARPRHFVLPVGGTGPDLRPGPAARAAGTGSAARCTWSSTTCPRPVTVAGPVVVDPDGARRDGDPAGDGAPVQAPGPAPTAAGVAAGRLLRRFRRSCRNADGTACASPSRR